MRTVIHVVISVLILAVGGLCYKLFGEKPEIDTKPEDVNSAALVETAEVSTYAKPLTVELDGEASTYRVITVSAQVAGKVAHKPEAIRGGRYVMPGDTLFEIESVTYQLEVDRLNAQMTQIDAELEGIQVDLQNTRELIALAKEELTIQQNNLARQKNLYQRNGSTQTAYEAALKQEIMARNALQTLENQVRSLTQKTDTVNANRKLVEAQRELALVNLARCKITSPIEGRLVTDVIEEGDYVKAGDTLVQISDASKMEIKCQMLAEELAWVWQAQLASIQASNGSGVVPRDPIELTEPIPCEVAFEFQGVETIWDGVLDRYEGTGLDRETRTFPCRVVVNHPRQTRTSQSLGGRAAITPPTLLSGMYVKVRIPVKSTIPLLAMPIEAVRPGGTVWLVREGVLQVLDVQVADTIGDTVLVREGNSVQAGDRVVISPLAAVSSGMQVRESADSKPTGPNTAASEVEAGDVGNAESKSPSVESFSAESDEVQE